MRILVTGSSGFVGSHLVPALQARGAEVVGIDRRSPVAGSQPDVFIKADLCNPVAWAESMGDVDEVIHLAAAKADWGLSEAEYVRDNHRATSCLLEVGVAAGIKRWLIFSTVGIYGPSSKPVSEDGQTTPDTDYGWSKLAAERELRRTFDARPGLDIVVLRPSAIFGPGNPPEANVYRLIKAIQAKRFLMVGDGRTLKSTSYIGNVIAATMFLLDRDPQERLEAYNYVDEPVLETRQLASIIAKHLGLRAVWPRIPLGLAATVGSVFDALGWLVRVDFPITSARIRKFCRDTTYSAERIRTLGFQAPYNFDSAIADTVRWDSLAGMNPNREFAREQQGACTHAAPTSVDEERDREGDWQRT